MNDPHPLHARRLFRPGHCPNDRPGRLKCWPGFPSPGLGSQTGSSRQCLRVRVNRRHRQHRNHGDQRTRGGTSQNRNSQGNWEARLARLRSNHHPPILLNRHPLAHPNQEISPGIWRFKLHFSRPSPVSHSPSGIYTFAPKSVQLRSSSIHSPNLHGSGLCSYFADSPGPSCRSELIDVAFGNQSLPHPAGRP